MKQFTIKFWPQVRSPVIVLASLLCAVILPNTILLCFASLPTVSPLTVRSERKVLEGIATFSSSRDARDQDDTVVLIGSSMLSFAVDLQQVEQCDVRGNDWLALGGQGCGPDTHDRIASALLDGGTSPRLALIMMRLYYWQSAIPRPAAAVPFGVASSASRRWARYVWPVEHQEQLSAWTAQVALRGKMRLSKMGVPLHQMLRECSTPRQPLNRWRDDPQKRHDLEIPGQEVASSEQAALAQRVQTSIVRWERGRFFDPDAYSGKPVCHESLWRVTRRLRAAGVEVYVIISPVHSRVRTSYPPEAYQALLRGCSDDPRRPIPILDLSAVLPDPCFHDVGHANRTGQLRFSEVLVRRVNQILEHDSRLPHPTHDDSRLIALRIRDLRADQRLRR